MEEKKVEYRLKGIELLSKFIEERKPEIVSLSEDFHFELSSEILVKKELKQLITITTISIFESIKMEVLLAKLKVALVVEVVNFDDVALLQGEGVYKILLGFDKVLISISISTCRGILFKELSGTYLHKAFLPIINIDTSDIK